MGTKRYWGSPVSTDTFSLRDVDFSYPRTLPDHVPPRSSRSASRWSRSMTGSFCSGPASLLLTFSATKGWGVSALALLLALT